MNQILDSIGIALSSIWANKLRSFMMVLGNIVAVTSIIAVVSLIQGMNGYVSDAIVRDVGVGTFRIEKVGFITDEEEQRRAFRRPNVTLTDARALREFGGVIDSVMAESGATANLVYHDVNLENTRVRGVSAEYEDFSGYVATLGRSPSRMEISRNRPVVLLGWDTADRLFKGQNPIDKVIQINHVHVRVLGVNEKKGSVFGNSQDEFAVIPLGSFQKMFGARRSLDLTIKPSDPSQLNAAMDEARVALRMKRHLRPNQPDNFGMYTSDTLMDFWRNFSKGAFAILIGVVSLSLVVGGIVIMNIMLMVVSERTREIGLRKALGARRRDIVWQVLTESTTLSIVGGVLGTIFGFTAAWLVDVFTPLPSAIRPWSVMLGISMTAIVGLFFGLYPAIRASRLDPIEALRRE
ncbi:MAG TPA: ABC transporter permease [Thermoanaerobaculia bacterium]